MATYQYRCAQHGPIEITQPIGTAPSTWPCGTGDHDAVRVFSSPMLSLTSRSLVRAMDNAERSRDQPDVVSSPPPHRSPARAHPALANPALRKLPRP